MSAVSPPGLSTMRTGGFCLSKDDLLMEYTKPFLTFEQQADLLISDRGMIAEEMTSSVTLKTLAITV